MDNTIKRAKYELNAEINEIKKNGIISEDDIDALLQQVEGEIINAGLIYKKVKGMKEDTFYNGMYEKFIKPKYTLFFDSKKDKRLITLTDLVNIKDSFAKLENPNIVKTDTGKGGIGDNDEELNWDSETEL